MSLHPQSDDADPRRIELTAASADATAVLGEALAAVLAAGDVVLLSGPLGAGKSHFARAVIRAWLGQPGAEIPSPSYTLVNVYEHTDGDIWHADLYRLGAVDELDELGLDEALVDAIVLVEWAERWQPPPVRRLEISFAPQTPDSRRLDVTAIGPGWSPALSALEAAA